MIYIFVINNINYDLKQKSITISQLTVEVEN